jgi:iron complex outermembrane receptor protein
MNNNLYKKTIINASVVAALYTPMAMAQNAATMDKESTQLETITVTSQKRIERLIDVPLSVTNVGKAELEQRGIKELRDLGDAAPNLTISQGNDFSSKVIIRGVGANSRNIGFDSRVGIYIDGVYLGQSPAINQGLVDLERIEVLRGPQGTLFGKNTIAGAVNLISQAPSDEFEGTVGVTQGNFSKQNFHLKLNTPLSDDTAFTFFLNQSTEDGYIENKLLNTTAGDKDETAGRVVLKSRVNDELTVSFNADYATQERAAISGVMLTGPFGGDPTTGPFGDILQGTANDKFATYQDTDSIEDKNVWGLSLTLDYEMQNDFFMKSITSHRKTDMNITIDVDRSALKVLNTDYRDIYSQTTQEFQLISPDQNKFKYMLGVYLFNLNSTSTRAGINGDQIGVFGDPRLKPGQNAVFIEGAVDTTSYALYTNASYELNEQWELGAGVRYSSETKDVDWKIDGSKSGFFALAVASLNDKRTDNYISPAVNINYAISPSSQAYARVSTGFKSGGYNLDFVTSNVFEAGLEFDKETVTSFELGYKAELLDKRLTFNTALFSAQYKDYQVNQFVDLGGGRTAISITNAAEVKTQGLELEFAYQATGDLAISGSLGLLDASFDSFPGGGTGGVDATGNRLSNAPEVSLSLGLTYYQEIPYLSSDLFYRLDYNYTGEQYFLVNNDDNYPLPNGKVVDYDKAESFSTLNARITLLTNDGAWGVSLWGQNLTDSDHMVGSFREFFGAVMATYAKPRSYGIEVKYNF